MKITPKKYGLALLAALEDEKDSKAVLRSFLTFLWRKKQFRLLPKILKSFEEAWNEKQGIAKVDVWYPKKFESTPKTLKTTLAKLLKKEPFLTAFPDDQLIGGYKLRYQDILIDVSISSQLKRFQSQLLAS